MKIKAKKGYNVIINDLNLSLSSNGKSIEVDEEKFNNSTDAKQLLKFIEIIKDDVNTNEVTSTKSNNNVQANKVSDQAFVIGSDNNKPIENAVLMDPDNAIKQPIKKIAKVNDATVIQPETKPAEKQETGKNADNNTKSIDNSANKPIDNSAAKIINTNVAKVISTDPIDNSKQLIKKAKVDKKVENKKVEEEKKDLAKA